MTDDLTRRLAENRKIIESATIPGFADYAATTEGKIISRLNWRGYGEREVTPTEGKSGYMKVRLRSPDGTRVNRAVHRLVALAFLGERPDGCQIRHLNGNKVDNRPENLLYGTAKENATDREEHGRTARGVVNGFSKLTEPQVIDIRRACAEGKSQRRVASDFGVSQKAVWSVVNGTRWTHV